MRSFAIRFARLMICATATFVIPLGVATEGLANSRHLRKHHLQTGRDWNASSRRSWAAQEIRPVAPAWNAGGDVCPGNARSFDCKIWPPPFDQDPDRRISGSDGGM